VHAEFVATEMGVRVRDLGSRNGTFVGGVRVGDVYLLAGRRSASARASSLRARAPREASRSTISPVRPAGGAEPRSCARSSIASRRSPRPISRSSSPARPAPARSSSPRRSTWRAPREEALRRRRLRLDPPDARRGHPLRPRARGLHRRGRQAPLALRQEADGGTIFLDELGELPDRRAAQAPPRARRAAHQERRRLQLPRGRRARARRHAPRSRARGERRHASGATSTSASRR
jgi:hypothetical protein